MEIEEIAALSAAQLLKLRYLLENLLSCTRSPSGGQLEALQNGIVGSGHSGAGRDADEKRRLQLLSLLPFCRDLTSQESATARLYYHTLQELEPYERNVRFADMQEGDGEEIIATKVSGPDGKVLDGYVRTRGQRLHNPTHAKVADYMAKAGATTADGLPMTEGAVKRRLTDARAKVTTAVQGRLFMAMLEGSAL